MINEVLITSFILLIIGCIGLVQINNTPIQKIISIETITLSSILNILYYTQIKTSILLLITIITISELHLAIFFVINNKIKNIQ